MSGGGEVDLATFWSPEKSKLVLPVKSKHQKVTFQPNLLSNIGKKFKYFGLSSQISVKYNSRPRGCNLNSWPQEMRLVDIYPPRKFWRIDHLLIYSSNILINWFASDGLVFIQQGNTKQPQIGKCHVSIRQTSENIFLVKRYPIISF